MSRWIIDDGPLGDLALQFDPGWSWPPGTLHVVREVAQAAAKDRSGRRTKLLNMTSGDSPAVVVNDLFVGSPAADMLFSHLRRNATDATTNLGEHASIAFCAVEATDGIFVANDKLAAFLALAELGPGRVASPFDLWDHLHRSNLITAEQFASLLKRTVNSASLPGTPLRFLGID